MTTQTELRPAASETSLLDMPTMSTDRALQHFIPEFDLDPETTAGFYGALPHKNKLPLADLRIHLSASVVRDEGRQNSTAGGMIWPGTEKLKYLTPELGKDQTDSPTLVVYVGTLMRTLEREGSHSTTDLQREINKAVTHELTHYAQGDPSGSDSEPEEAKRRLNPVKRMKSIGRTATMTMLGAAYDRRWARTGMSTLAASEIFSDASLPVSLKVAFGAAALTHLTGRKSRARQIDQLTAPGAYATYREREKEINARAHEDGSVEIVKIPPGEFTTTHLDNVTVFEDKRKKFSRFATRQTHRSLSRRPPTKAA
jgi:hypothetical protein